MHQICSCSSNSSLGTRKTLKSWPRKIRSCTLWRRTSSKKAIQRQHRSNKSKKVDPWRLSAFISIPMSSGPNLPKRSKSCVPCRYQTLVSLGRSETQVKRVIILNSILWIWKSLTLGTTISCLWPTCSMVVISASLKGSKLALPRRRVASDRGSKSLIIPQVQPVTQFFPFFLHRGSNRSRSMRSRCMVGT